MKSFNSIKNPTTTITSIKTQNQLKNAGSFTNDLLLAPLKESERQQKKPQQDQYKILCPMANQAPPFTEQTPSYHNKQFNSTPSALYPYRTHNNALIGYIVRWDVRQEDGTNKKETRPYIFIENEQGHKVWHSQGLPQPCPLYNLIELIEHPERSVLLCEGEKTVEAAKSLFPSWVCVTSAQGAHAAHKTDWSTLKGRDLILCPDVDDAGQKYIETVATLCKKEKVTSLKILSLEKIVKKIFEKENLEQGYDLADAAQEGLQPHHLTPDMIDQALSTYAEIDTPIMPEGFRINEKQEIEYLCKRKNNKGEILEENWKWLSGPLLVKGRIRDKNNEGWAKRVTLTDADHVSKEINVSSKLLAGDTKLLAEILLDYGLDFKLEAISELKKYLYKSNSDTRFLSVHQVGWHKDLYVLPEKTYGKEEKEKVLLQLNSKVSTYRNQGTLQEWQDNIGRYAQDNSRLQAGILFALACSLLTPLGRENMGIHFVGTSSCGKSTALRVACSVYGSEFRSWRTTDNAAESWGLSSNDNLLALDDMGQSSPDTVAEMTYMLGNGAGKGRANKEGGARHVAQFKLGVLSTGEVGISEKLKEGRSKRNYYAGQAIRLLEIPANAQKNLGIFENKHHFTQAADLSKHLGTMCNKYCGILGDTWLTLLSEQKEDMTKLVQEAEELFYQDTPLPPKADGQVLRAQQMFALIAAVGEVAIQKKLLNWPQECANQAMQILLQDWLKQRGGIEAHEEMEMIKRVEMFLQKDGSSRFEWIQGEGEGQVDPQKIVYNRAGYKQLIEGKVTYFAYPKVFEEEIIGKNNKQEYLETLVKKRYLQRDKQHFAKEKRIQGIGKKRFYFLSIPEDKTKD